MVFLPPNTLRRARQNDGTGQQSCACAEELDQLGHIEDHVIRAPILHHLAIQGRLNAQCMWIGDLIGRHETGP